MHFTAFDDQVTGLVLGPAAPARGQGLRARTSAALILRRGRRRWFSMPGGARHGGPSLAGAAPIRQAGHVGRQCLQLLSTLPALWGQVPSVSRAHMTWRRSGSQVAAGSVGGVDMPPEAQAQVEIDAQLEASEWFVPDYRPLALEVRDSIA